MAWMTGYPMQDAGAMVEAANALEWERLNRPTDGEALRRAAKSLRYAIGDLDEAADRISEAAELLADTPEGDRVASALDSMKFILKELRRYQQKWGAAG